MKNYLICGGTVFDGLGAAGRRVDVRVRDGHITEIGPNLRAAGQGRADESLAEEIVDASGLIVTSGLIDLHTHVFAGVGRWSIEPGQAGLRTGVTTLLDTGTAGALTYEGFERYVIKEAGEDIFALLNISMLGCLQGYPNTLPHSIGELADAGYAHAPSAIACVQQHKERLIGLKVRLTSSLAAHNRENEEAGLSAALEAGAACDAPLMVHHAASRVPLSELLARLRPGDIYTHLYHPHPDGGFVNAASLAAMREARSRGVLFDVGHGKGAFAWHVSEKACRECGFWPDTISTDVHAFNLHGPVWDLPTTMSKFLHLGMPLAEIVRAVTYNAARAMRLEHRFGSLQVGREADITLLRLEETAVPLPDVLEATRPAPRLVPLQVWKRGERFNCTPAAIANPAVFEEATPQHR
ncbi:MAG: hypothetical protein JWN98_1637 [Abditibacteriota bacterium]|nr:hypothetical protein [Abditibacteriota bacterium]